MRYLIIIPNYTGSCIQDEFNGEIQLGDLKLPEDFINEITIWHNSYREIIPLSLEDREKRMDQIKKLDIQGLDLANKLKNLVPEGAKVKYFSEGLLKYLPDE